MRLFHVSEEPDIRRFEPRVPARDDLDKGKGLVWALNERCLPNFLTPRDCPRVAYHAHEGTTREDISRFFSASSLHCVAIERGWHQRMLETSLFLYEFDAAHFYLQDESAGYYVSERAVVPIAATKCVDLYEELFARNVEVRILDYLWTLGREVEKSTMHWSLCRMRNAIPERVK